MMALPLLSSFCFSSVSLLLVFFRKPIPAFDNVLSSLNAMLTGGPLTLVSSDDWVSASSFMVMATLRYVTVV